VSKGPGRIERAVEAAFKGNLDGYFSRSDLVAMVFPGDGPITRAMRNSVARAAENVCGRLHWVKFKSWSRGGEAIYANGLSLRSYALGQTRAYRGYDDPERVAKEVDTDRRTIEKMQPGGDWDMGVQYRTALANGDDKKAAKLKAAIEKKERALLARLAG
jgi:hypothetical protein